MQAAYRQTCGQVVVVTRIVAGTLGGRRIVVPPGERTRPTSDRVREALFSTLDSMTELVGARFLDLYAGSGAVGLEAYSRGAAHVLLIESELRAARTIRTNIAALRAAPAVRLVIGKVAQVLAAGPGGEPYDIVFADPPYAVSDREVVELLAALLDRGWLAPEGVVVIERPIRGAPVTWVEGITPERSRRYGETALWYGRRS